MKPDRKFLRQCCICRSYKKKEELIRITRNFKTNEAVINKDGSVFGRSMYLCKNEECIKKFLKNKKILNLLNAKNSDEIKNVIQNYK